MNEINYFKIVQESLIENWSRHEPPLCINEADLSVGMALFATIAVETIMERSSTQSESIDKCILVEPKSLTEVIKKIKAFVEEKADDFKDACQTGFPFSHFNNKASERALEHVLKLSCNSILSYFMMLTPWMGEPELEARFGASFKALQLREIVKACAILKHEYIRNGDQKAGYYLLWLIKQAAGCSYEIPPRESFTPLTVAKVLSRFFRKSGSVTNPEKLVEIFIYQGLNGSLYKFLYQKSCPIFLNFTAEQLQNISPVKWPEILTCLLIMLTHENKLFFTKILVSSDGRALSTVGKLLLSALEASSLNEAIPYFYALKELLPKLTYTDIQMIFDRPFIKFCRKSICKNDFEFTKRLQFNELRKVFVYDSLMIGVYNANTMIAGERTPPYLLAYDIKTEKMVWGIPLESPRYILKKAAEFLSLQFIGGKNVYLIDPKTGEYHSTLELPEVSKSTEDWSHISPQGIAYQRGGYRIMGGKMIGNQWIPTFEAEDPGGKFVPLSTHCGVHDNFRGKLVLFGPTGDQITIQDCIDVQAQEDKLYTIEKDPTHADICLLKIRTLKIDKEVVSNVEKTISLKFKKTFFSHICQNGQVILFLNKFVETSLIFVDLHKEEVTYSQHEFYSEYSVSTDSGELWTWDQTTEKLWKISKTKITLMGSLKSSSSTRLLHVDKKDQLYFADSF